MGCGQNKQIIQITDNNTKNHLKLFEEYSELDINTYTVYYYQLLWKTRPVTCIYQLKEQDSFNKKKVSQLDEDANDNNEHINYYIDNEDDNDDIENINLDFQFVKDKDRDNIMSVEGQKLNDFLFK